jgi:hypothetical protein
VGEVVSHLIPMKGRKDCLIYQRKDATIHLTEKIGLAVYNINK